jgi:hypothetical protein
MIPVSCSLLHGLVKLCQFISRNVPRSSIGIQSIHLNYSLLDQLIEQTPRDVDLLKAVGVGTMRFKFEFRNSFVGCKIRAIARVFGRVETFCHFASRFRIFLRRCFPERNRIARLGYSDYLGSGNCVLWGNNTICCMLSTKIVENPTNSAIYWRLTR